MSTNKSANKFEYISNLLVNSKKPEDILNDEKINIESDFQYICLSSGKNYDLVTDVIAEIANNGNVAIVEENINLISMNMWKDLFNKNEAIKKIFVNNFDTIYDNTNVMTCTEVDAFISDKKTSNLIYSYLDDIIVKLTTQDRASLIRVLNEKKNGPSLIKQNLHCFFKKGAYGISTTYSKILTRLEKVNGIQKIDILRACCDNFSDMIIKATAFEDETIKLIKWCNNALDEVDIGESERKYITNKIDKSVIENYDSILEKTNYSIENATILKKFEEKRNALSKMHSVESNNDEQNQNDTQADVVKNEITNEVKDKSNDLSKKEDFGTTKKYELSNDLINSYINRYSKKNSSESTETNPEDELQEKIRKLIYNNIHQTDKIVDKVLTKNENIENQVSEKKENEEKTVVKVEESKNEKTPKISNTIATEVRQDNPIKINEKERKQEDNPIHEPVKKQTALVLANPEAKRFLKKGFIKRIFKRVLKIFGYQKEKRKIDDVWN